MFYEGRLAFLRNNVNKFIFQNSYTKFLFRERLAAQDIYLKLGNLQVLVIGFTVCNFEKEEIGK